MSAFKDGRYPVVLDRKRHMLFSLNILDELNDKAGGYDNLGEYLQGKDIFKRLRWLLTLLINEGAEDGEEPLTETQVGKFIHIGNLKEVQDSIYRAFSIAVKGDTDIDADIEADNDETEKNAVRG